MAIAAGGTGRSGSALLALVATGLLIWAVTIQSGLDSTEHDLANANRMLESTGQGARQHPDQVLSRIRRSS
jgi:hypothetical protein